MANENQAEENDTEVEVRKEKEQLGFLNQLLEEGVVVCSETKARGNSSLRFI